MVSWDALALGSRNISEFSDGYDNKVSVEYKNMLDASVYKKGRASQSAADDGEKLQVLIIVTARSFTPNGCKPLSEKVHQQLETLYWKTKSYVSLHIERLYLKFFQHPGVRNAQPLSVEACSVAHEFLDGVREGGKIYVNPLTLTNQLHGIGREADTPTTFYKDSGRTEVVGYGDGETFERRVYEEFVFLSIFYFNAYIYIDSNIN